MTLTQGTANTSFTVTAVGSEDKEIRDFLFTLGCYPGEEVSIISILSSTVVIHVKNARYSIDADLAEIIHVEPAGSGEAQSIYA